MSEVSTADVSVVMCTYNGEEYIEQQLRSILAQTVPPAEVLISDDGSSDRTLEIARAIGASSSTPIRIHRNEKQLGYAQNFLTACEQSGSRLIAFCDQDDVWAPRKLELGMAALVDNKAVLSVHAIQEIDGAGALLRSEVKRFARTRVIRPLSTSPWGNFKGFTMLFERSLLEKIPESARGLDVHTQGAELSHDRWIYFLATTFGRTVVLKECLADYRQHGSQLYGGSTDRTVKERVATKLRAGREQSLYLAGVAAHRARLLESLMPERDRQRWLDGAARWRTIERHLVNSAGLYDAPKPSAQLRLLGANLRRGTYRSFRHGGLGLERLAEDVCISVLAKFWVRDRLPGDEVGRV